MSGSSEFSLKGVLLWEWRLENDSLQVVGFLLCVLLTALLCFFLLLTPIHPLTNLVVAFLSRLENPSMGFCNVPFVLACYECKQLSSGKVNLLDTWPNRWCHCRLTQVWIHRENMLCAQVTGVWSTARQQWAGEVFGKKFLAVASSYSPFPVSIPEA